MALSRHVSKCVVSLGQYRGGWGIRTPSAASFRCLLTASAVLQHSTAKTCGSTPFVKEGRMLRFDHSSFVCLGGLAARQQRTVTDAASRPLEDARQMWGSLRVFIVNVCARLSLPLSFIRDSVIKVLPM